MEWRCAIYPHNGLRGPHTSRKITASPDACAFRAMGQVFLFRRVGTCCIDEAGDPPDGIHRRDSHSPSRRCSPRRTAARAGPARWGSERMRAIGEDPAHSWIASPWRGEKMARAQRAFREWDAEHGGEADPEEFQQEVLPRLQHISLGATAKATGLSEGYCSFIRRGGKVSHRRHREKLRSLDCPRSRLLKAS